MKLYVLRHGHSPGAMEAGVTTDEARPLSDQGRRDVREAAERLAAVGAAPRIILSSPLTRAKQTAAEAAAVLQPNEGVRIYDPLSNQITGAALGHKIFKDYAAYPELLIVGHQPQLGELVAALSCKTVELRPAGLVALDAPGGRPADLLWSKNP